MVSLLSALVTLASLLVAPAALAAAPTVTMTASATQVPYQTEVSFRVQVVGDAGPVAGADVQLVRTGADGVAAPVDFDVTDPTGATTVTDTPTASGTYVATVTDYPAPDYLPVTSASAPLVVTVAYFVTSAVSPTAIPPGGALTLTVTTAPAAVGTATVEERVDVGPWRSLGVQPVAADGSVRLALGTRSAVGTYTYRVTRSADAAGAAGVAEATTKVTVTGAGKRTSWAPLYGSRSRPPHWGTCRIGYRVNPANVPTFGRADLTEAMRRVTQVSGIRFRYLGRTSLVPRSGDARAGNGRITVAWANGAATRGLLRPGIGGVGGTTSTATGRLFTGFLVLNTGFSRTAEPGFGSGASHGLVLMHELGHVVGLGHVNNRRDVMYPSAYLPAAVWGAGDRTGLARLGRLGGCR